MKNLKSIVLRFIWVLGMLTTMLCVSAYDLRVRMIVKGTDKLLTEFEPILSTVEGMGIFGATELQPDSTFLIKEVPSKGKFAVVYKIGKIHYGEFVSNYFHTYQRGEKNIARRH